MILYINSCVREHSRTDELARYLLSKFNSDYIELNLQEENLSPLSEETICKRTELSAKGDFSDSMFRYAKLFAQADTIVISAPFWDMSFPSLLKLFIENIYVIGLVSRYGEDGCPVGLCKASKLYYVSTAGGFFSPEFGYDYIKSLVQNCFGIKQTQLFVAQMLDIVGSDVEEIIKKVKNEIDLNF